MKIKAFAIMLVVTIFLFATTVSTSNHTIIYGIGEATFSGMWLIGSGSNNFSGVHIADLYNNTQIWILHHALNVQLEDGDSLLHYDYAYRYYKQSDPFPEWRFLEPVFSGPYLHESGYWYWNGYVDYAWLLDLPLDTGDYYLEFKHSASIYKANGDTSSIVYLLPDSMDFKAEFTVIPYEQDGTEGSSPIILSNINAIPSLQGVTLTWCTESEFENSHYLIYRNGEVIAQVEGYGTSTETHTYSYIDRKVAPGEYEYAISDVSYGGVEAMHERVVVKVGPYPARFKLNMAYPNPFNPRTAISYSIFDETTIDRQRSIDLSIYNTNGEKVSTLFNGEQTAGQYQVIWDASDLPSGIYIVRMMAGDMMRCMKVVLMK